MDYKHRMELVRLNGPRRPILRHVLLVLALYDSEAGGLVFAGRLEQETGYSDRAIRRALRDLVTLGWLKPEKPPKPGQLTLNQYGAVDVDRVHGHTGGCGPGGQGQRTRYWITYRTTPASEPPPGRRPVKGERGAGQEGGSGGRPADAVDAGRGNGGPGRGNGGPNKGDPRSPDREGSEMKCDAGGYPPSPPGEAGSGPPYGGPGSPQGADAPVSGADAPQGSQGTQGSPDRPEGTRHLLARWSDVIATVMAKRNGEPGIRLWLDTPKVKPLHCTGPVLHVAVPSLLFVKMCGRFSADLAAAVSALTDYAVSDVVYHPAKEAA